MIRAIMILMGCLVLTGCQQTKSFMHMNSDSSSPFFGLQLAVDRNSPAVEVPSLRNDAQNSSNNPIEAPASYLTKAGPAKAGPAKTGPMKATGRRTTARRTTGAELGAGADSNFSYTATEDVLRGDLKMALPKASPKSGSQEADQLADLLHRLKQS